MAIVLFTALGAALRFIDIGHQGLWYDESFTAYLMRFSFGKMLGLIPQTESTPPLYYCVAWLWTRLFGDTAVGLKSLSAVFGTLAIPVAYAAARKLLTNRRTVLILTALTACNPLLIWYSQEARAYSMLVLMSAGSLLAFAYAREQPSARRLAAWATVCGLALATHYYASLIVVPEAIWLLCRHPRRPALYAAIGFVVACGAALLPLLIAQTRTGRDNWIAHASLGRRLAQVLPLFLIGTGTPAREAIKFTAFTLAAIAITLLLYGANRRERHSALLVGGLALGGFAFNLLLVAAGEDTLLTRNMLALWLPGAMLLACGLGIVRVRILGICVASALCAIGVTATIAIDTDYWLQRPNWGLVAAALGPAPPRGQARLVLVQANPGLLPLGFYMPDLWFAPRHRLSRLTEIDVITVISHPGLGGYCWWGSDCNLVAAPMQANYPIRGFHAVWTKRIRQFLVREMVATRPLTLTRQEIAQALTKPAWLRHDGLLVQQRSGPRRLLT